MKSFVKPAVEIPPEIRISTSFTSKPENHFLISSKVAENLDIFSSSPRAIPRYL
jgi:hypothetical protein